MGVIAEAWTMPTSATFEPKLTFDLTGGSGSRILSGWTDEEITVAATVGDPDADSGLSDLDVVFDQAPWIRIYESEPSKHLISEFRALRAATPLKRPSETVISGPARNGLVEGLAVYPFDWPTQPSKEPDWVFGGENTLPALTLGDLANIKETWELHSTTDPFTITVDTQTTDPMTSPSALVIENRLQALSTVTDVTVRGAGTTTDPWVIVFYNPPNPAAVSASSGTFDQTQAGSLDPKPITVSQYADQRIEPLLHGANYGDPPIEVVTDNLNTGSTWALLVRARSQFCGCQIVQTGVEAGTYQASIPVKPTVDGSYRLVIRDRYEGFVAWTSPSQVPLTAGTYQDLEVPDVPILTTGDYIYRVAVVSADPATHADFYVDWEHARFDRGMPQATPGKIIRLLTEAAQTRDTFTFLELGFTDTHDSAGEPWPTELSFTAFADSDLGHVSDDLHQLNPDPSTGDGYEWDITDTDTPGFTHRYDLWGPNTAGTKIDDWTTPPTLVAGSAPEFDLIRHGPTFSVGLGHGSEGLYSELVDAGIESQIGRFETAFDADGLADPATLTERLQGEFGRQRSNEKAAHAVVHGDDQSVPLRHYGPADEAWWMFPPLLTKEARRVRRVDWQVASPTRYVVSGSKVSSPEAAQAEAVNRYLRELKRRSRRTKPSAQAITGGGSEMTVTVAAADATGAERGRADFVCTGVDDDQVWMAAYASISGSGSGVAGRIKLSSGRFNINGDAVTFSEDVWLQGSGPLNTEVWLVSGTTAITLDGSCDGKISDLSLVGGDNTTVAIHSDGNGDTYLRDIWFFSWGTAWLLESNFSRGTGLRSQSGSIGWLVRAVGDGYRDLTLSGCYTGGTIELPSFVGVSIANNILGGAIIGTDPRDWSIVGNTWIAAFGATTALIELGGAPNTGDSADGSVVVAANTAPDIGIPFVSALQVEGLTCSGNFDSGGGYLVDQCTGFNIAGNTTLRPYLHGIQLIDSDDGAVTSNVIHHPSQLTDSTYDGVNMTTSDRNLVASNLIRSDPTVSARYGVNVVSGDRNVVVGNSLGDPAQYGTDALVDSGTNTQLAYPNDATYGDNFT